MAPAPAPTIRPVQWQGIALGENIDAVRARLGSPEFNRKVIMGSMLVEYPIHGGEGTLLLETSERQVTSIRVEAAAPKDLSLPIGDPFGVNLGDSLTRLLAIRGDPNRSDEDGPDDSNSIYGTSTENRWIYSIHDGTVVGISLVAPKPPSVNSSGPSNPGLTLHGTPPPRKGIVIKGTPSPVVMATGATAKPAATPLPGVALASPKPVPVPSPTPVPGVALASAAPSQPPAAPARPTPTPRPSPTSSPSQTAMTPASGATALPEAPPSGSPVAPSSGAVPGPSPTPPADGSSVKTAIVVRAPDQATGFDYIYKFIENIGCADGSAQYRVVDQTFLDENRHNYARVIGECATTHERRAFYFDITYIFTRSDR
jgi:hypothetical protein